MDIFKKKLVGHYKSLFKKLNKEPSWKDIEYFNPKWKSRIRLMANHITQCSSLTDYGCGKMWLKEFIKPDIQYYGVDYIKRDEDTIICDLNNYEFPTIETDLAFVSGCLEYITDYDWFINEICSHHEKCVLSYCTYNSFPDIQERLQKAWTNNLKEEQLILLFENNGFSLKYLKQDLNTIFYFENT